MISGRTTPMNRMHQGTGSDFVRAKKSLGQNFCCDQRIPDEIVRRLAATSQHHIWEIGPGQGALTGKLARTGARMHLFEIDERMRPVLGQKFASIEITWGDFLELSDEKLPPAGEHLLVCGNLPYYCGTPIIRRFLENGPQAERIVFLLQEEVAKKAAAACNTSDYSYLSVHTAFFAQASIGSTFGPGSFVPPPKINSTILQLEPLLLTPADRERRHQALKFISLLFQQRRKMALPLLKKRFGETDWQERFDQLGIDHKARPENISPNNFLALFAPAKT
ncbi:MAG: ribosomal RNA small subunit methyltransferase A [Candidatus Riflebacteria bacterium HGW-Riflebacteria-1]|nr:MAG: ribosomal RNA small subunit methyltransferase A [Candidatus Riflebacteria bacterium HGW-Riflebacteria-1]